MKQKTRFKNFENIGYQYRLLVHEWPIYRYRPQKSHIGRSLVHSPIPIYVPNVLMHVNSVPIP